MENLVDLILKILENTEKKHFVLLKNIIRFLLIIGIASVFYEIISGKYYIIDFSIKSIVEYFDRGTFWICFIYFLTSACLYLALHLIIVAIFNRKTNKKSMEFENQKTGTQLFNFGRTRNLFYLMENAFFTYSSHIVLNASRKNKFYKWVCRSIKLVKHDAANNIYSIDTNKKKFLQNMKMELGKNKQGQIIDLFADILACIVFLFGILAFKSMPNSAFVFIGIFVIFFFVLSFLSKVFGTMKYVIPEFEYLFEILHRIVESKNRNEKRPNTSVYLHIPIE